MQKGFADYFAALHADFFCLQETKLQPEQIAVDFPGYLQFWNSAEKKGYSGTAVFTKHPPLSVTYGVGIDELDHEGRMITLEYGEVLSCHLLHPERAGRAQAHRPPAFLGRRIPRKAFWSWTQKSPSLPAGT